MQALTAFFRYLRLLLLGLWGAIGAVLQGFSILALLASFLVPQLEPTRWAVIGLILLAILISGFRVYRKEVTRRIGLEKDIEALKKPKFDAKTRRVAEDGWARLRPDQKEAIRLLFIEGDLTESQGLQRLQAKGYGAIYYPIARETNFVQRVVPGRQSDEHVHGYTAPYTINPKFRPILEELVQQMPETQHK